MTDRYEKIREALAMGPTPGPWEQDGDGVSAYDEDVAVAVRALLEERDELAKLVAEMRGTLRDLRIRLHAAGRRPEECYEMSMIDDALDYERIRDALNGGGE